MLWTFFAALTFAYMLAVALTQLVGQDLAARELWENAEFYCGTVTRSLYTILQVMTMDCVTEPVLRPMYHAAPTGLFVPCRPENITGVSSMFDMLNLSTCS